VSETLNAFWNSISSFQDQFIGLAITLAGTLLVYLFRPKVKLIFGHANNSLNTVSVPDQEEPKKRNSTEIYIEKFFLQNEVRNAANNVEFVLSNFPTDVSVNQPRNEQYLTVGKGNCLISIPQIAPGELVVIDCAYINQKAAFVTSVKCAECLGKQVPFWTLRKFPTWCHWIIWCLVLLGIAFVLQVLIKLLG
jgi:hypothetical protein